MFCKFKIVCFFLKVISCLLLVQKSILNVSQLKFREETTPQSSHFGKQHGLLTSKTFSLFVPQQNFFVIPKRFKSEKQLFIQESGYYSGLISKDKDHKNLPVSPFLPGANSRVDY